VANKVLDKCPGSKNIRAPIPTAKICPGCGEEVEIWSDELKARCARCGTTVFREDIPACIDWCKAARECLGKEKYNRLMEGKAKTE
jgi:NADH pyrophosphatase NudC (nudix superfamily)